LPNIQNVKYVKRNDVRLKTGTSEESNKILFQFLGSIEGKVKGLRGFVVMNHTTDENEMMVLTLWESEYDMEVFYHPSNKAFSEFVDRASPLFGANPKELTMQYHFLEYDISKPTNNEWLRYTIFFNMNSIFYLPSVQKDNSKVQKT
jgi:heme-degrading monooxygenase HmoA